MKSTWNRETSESSKYVLLVCGLWQLVGCGTTSMTLATDYFVGPDSSGRSLVFSDKGSVVWVVTLAPSPTVAAVCKAQDGTTYGTVAMSPDGQRVAVTETTANTTLVRILDRHLREIPGLSPLQSASVLSWTELGWINVVKGKWYGLRGGPTGKYRLEGAQSLRWDFTKDKLSAIVAKSVADGQTATLGGNTYIIDYVDKASGYDTSVFRIDQQTNGRDRTSNISGASYTGLWSLPEQRTLLVQRQFGSSSQSGLYLIDLTRNIETKLLSPEELRQLHKQAEAKLNAQ